MTNLIDIEHPTGRPNFTRIDIADGRLTIWFSYQTPVAFRPGWGSAVLVRRNQWGPTTGKHLNYIDGGNKTDRLEPDTFDTAYQLATQQVVEAIDNYVTGWTRTSPSAN